MTSGEQSRLGVIPNEGIKAPCVTIAITNITLYGLQTVGGVAVGNNQRVIVGGQTNTTQNGLWLARDLQDWVRTSDFNASDDVSNGQLVVNSNTGVVYIIAAPSNWVPGTGVVTFAAALTADSFAWGDITGTLSAQTDLQNAFDLKVNLNNPTFTGVVSLSNLAFPATQVPSADPNTQDDYEEGDWTPVLTDLSNNATTSETKGRYLKIGDTVFVRCSIKISSLGSVSGNLYLSGLPFTAAVMPGTITSISAIQSGYATGLSITAGTMISGYVGSNTTSITITLWDVTAGISALQESEWSADGEVIFSGSYEV